MRPRPVRKRVETISVMRSLSNANCVIEAFRTRQFTSRKLLAGARSDDYQSGPIGPPDVKTATRRLGGPAINRSIAPDTRPRNAGGLHATGVDQAFQPVRHRRFEHALERAVYVRRPAPARFQASLNRASAGTRCLQHAARSRIRSAPSRTACGQPARRLKHSPPAARFAPAGSVPLLIELNSICAARIAQPGLLRQPVSAALPLEGMRLAVPH